MIGMLRARKFDVHKTNPEKQKQGRDENKNQQEHAGKTLGGSSHIDRSAVDQG